MPDTCEPILIPKYPLPRERLSRNDYMKPQDAFADFRTAKVGQPIGIKFKVVHRDGVLNAISPGAILLSQGPEQEFDEISMHDALRRADLHDALEVQMYAHSMIQNLEDVHWHTYGWLPSSERYGFHMRELWIFSRAAVLLNNIHTAYLYEVEELAFQALVMHEEPESNHEVLHLASYINNLLRVTSTAAIPFIVESWPEGVPESTIPFAPVDPDRLIAKT